MPDIVIKFDELERLIDKLGPMITELDSGDRGDAIETAIGWPFMRSELATAARESESRWASKRADLVTELEAIRDHAQEIHDSFQQFDEEAAAKFESGADVTAAAGGTR